MEVKPGEELVPEVSDILGAKIVKIAHKYRIEGIPIDTIKFCFHKQYLNELNLQKIGFKSMDQLINILIEKEYPIQLVPNGDGFHCLTTNLETYFRWLSVLKVRKEFDLLNILVDCPEDAVLLGQHLPEFQFPQYFQFNSFPEILSGNILNDLKYVPIKLMSITSPHEMYCQFCGPKHHNSYHKLRNEMRFYDKTENFRKYRVPSLLLVEDLICAVKYPKLCNEWHRSKILSIDRNNVRLVLIDLGDIICENANQICLLKKSFASLPAQMVKIQLSGIRPFGKPSIVWSKSAKSLVKRLEDHNYCGDVLCAFNDFQNDRYRVFIKYYDRFLSNHLKDLLFLHQILVDKKLALITGNDFPID